MVTFNQPSQSSATAEPLAPIKPARTAVRKSPAASTASPRRRTTAASATLKPAVPVPEKNTKAKKPKLVRDSFTFPKDEYEAIEALKLRAARLSQPAKKSEVLRAGLMALIAMSDTAFSSALKAVPAIKTGRPKSEK